MDAAADGEEHEFGPSFWRCPCGVPGRHLKQEIDFAGGENKGRLIFGLPCARRLGTILFSGHQAGPLQHCCITSDQGGLGTPDGE